MCAKTTVSISPNFSEDKMWLNGVEETFDNPRLQACLNESKWHYASEYIHSVQ